MKITVSNIPSLFPDGYSEQFYDSNRVVGLGLDTEIIDTSDTYIIAGDLSNEVSDSGIITGDYKKLNIQAVTYDKYELKFILTESVNIDLLRIGETVVKLDSGNEHDVDIIDFGEPVRLSDTEFREYTIIYRDKSSRIQIDYLGQDYIQTLGIQLPYICFSSGNTYYSRVMPVRKVEYLNETVFNDRGIDKLEYRSVKTSYAMRLYLADDELVSFKNDLSDNSLLQTEFSPINGIESFNPAEVGVDVGDIDLYGLNSVDLHVIKEVKEEMPLMSSLTSSTSSNSVILYFSKESGLPPPSPAIYFYTFASSIAPVFSFGDYRQVENDDNGLKLIASQFGEDQVTIRLYLDEDQLINVKKYMPTYDTVKVVFNSVDYNAIELPTIEELESPTSNMRIVQITLKYGQVVNYPYA